MRVNVALLAVIGRKTSGKTTVVEGLISELTKKGLQVATAKHIDKKNFSMDTEGTDTWRHSTAGANPVVAVSDSETTIKLKAGTGDFSVDRLVKVAGESGADVLMLEGFSSYVLKDKRVGKILCLRSLEEYDEFKEESRGELLAFCSFKKLGEPVLDIREGLQAISEGATEFIAKRKAISEILRQLPGLDCRKCGKATCEELAEAIHEGEASLDDCIPLKFKPKLKTRITVGDSEVAIQPFVSETIRRSVLGMVSALKGVDIKGKEEVHIAISE